MLTVFIISTDANIRMDENRDMSENYELLFLIVKVINIGKNFLVIEVMSFVCFIPVSERWILSRSS